MLKNIDNVVLVALVEWCGRFESQASLATDLKVSTAGLSRSLNRLDFARLIRRRDFSVIKPHAEEYLVHGLRYVFPVKLGSSSRGVPTAHSAPPLSEKIASQENFVWPAEFGKMLGLEIVPLHENVPALCVAYKEFHPVFAVIDAIRVGRARERQLAKRFVKDWLKND
jgi:hypothetical protein